jgi:ABC-type phosphate/phosphonate transport system permease subunit
MKDRFTLGFIAGIIGAIPMNAMSLFNYHVTHLAELRYLDFAGFMIFGKLPKTAGEVILSQIVQLAFSGVLGALFAKFLEWVTPENAWFKGVLWGTGAWFVLYSITVIYKIPALSTPNFTTALLQNISTAIYGIILGLTFGWLVRKAETEIETGHTLKKYRILPMPSYKKGNDHKKAHIRKPHKIK